MRESKTIRRICSDDMPAYPAKLSRFLTSRFLPTQELEMDSTARKTGFA